MAISATIPAIQSWAWLPVNLVYADGTTAKDLVAGTTNGRRVTTITCWSDATAPGSSIQLVIEGYDGTTYSTIYTTTLTNTAYTQQLNLQFADVVLPSSSHKIRARVSTNIQSAANLMFLSRCGDY